MNFVIYIPGDTLNDATQYYVHIIEQAILSAGFNVKKVKEINLIDKEEIIIVINIGEYLKIKKIFSNKKYICWYQGIPQEELMMNGSLNFNQKIVSLKLFLLEKFDLHSANLNIFVSESQEQYLYNKHRLKKPKQSFIMPCYNKSININAFYDKKYQKSTFVYAGSVNKWQCIEKTLEIYSLIENQLTNSKLTLLVKESQELLDLIDKYGIKNYEIKYIKLEMLDEEFSKHKYGFLLREPHIVNKVSTPTKMNSYLANGLICIYTSAVDSFEKNINLEPYSIKFNSIINSEDCANKILKFDKEQINSKLLYKKYKNLFDDYYSDQKYIATLSKKIKEIYGDSK